MQTVIPANINELQYNNTPRLYDVHMTFHLHMGYHCNFNYTLPV